MVGSSARACDKTRIKSGWQIRHIYLELSNTKEDIMTDPWSAEIGREPERYVTGLAQAKRQGFSSNGSTMWEIACVASHARPNHRV